MKKYNSIKSKFVSRILVCLCILSMCLVSFDVRASEPVDEVVTDTAVAGSLPEDEKIDSESKQPEVDSTSETTDATTGQDDEIQVTPRGPALIISKYNITELQGETIVGKIERESFSQSGQNTMDRYTLNAKNTYNADGTLTFKVRQTGTSGSVSFISPECQVVTGGTSEHVLGSDGGVVEFTQQYSITNISKETKELKIQCVVQTKYSGGNPRTIYRTLVIPVANDRTEAPTTPEIMYDTQNPDGYTLTGIDTTMEYASFADPYRAAYEWSDCTGETMVLAPGTSELVYLVRYKATENTEASNYKQLKLLKRTAAPAVTLDQKNELLSGLTTEMEYCIDDGEYLPVTEEFIQGSISDILDKISENSDILKIRFRANGKPASMDRTITLYKRLDMPQNIVFNPMDFSITGLVKAVEYQVDTENTWYAVKGTSINLASYGQPDREVNVKIRYSYTGQASNSKSVVVTLPRIKNAPDELKINYNTEQITGFDTTCRYQYASTPNGAYYDISLKNGEYDIKNRIGVSIDGVIYIRKAATKDTPLTASVKIVIPKRKAAPANDIKFIYNDPSTNESQVLLTNVDTQIEFKRGSEEVWNSCGGNEVIEKTYQNNIIYCFREKATENAFASLEKKVTMVGRGAAPRSYLSLWQEKISPLFSTSEYRINDGEFQPVGDMIEMPLSDIASSLSKDESYTVTMRRMRTADAPISFQAVFKVPPRPEAPKNISYNTSTYVLSGLSNTMEYREVGTEKWITLERLTGSTLNFKPFVDGRPYNVQIEVRYEYTSTAFVSHTVKVNLY